MCTNWSDLPPELLVTIASKLTIYDDYIRFRAVCKTWRFSTSQKPNDLPPQLPWLLVPQSNHNNTRTFFSLSQQKYIFLNLPGLSHGKRYCGSSQGWLAVLSESPDVVLLNGITNAQVFLPDLTRFPCVVDFNVYNVGRESTLMTRNGAIYRRTSTQMRDFFIKKVVLSCGPFNVGEFIALAILHGGDMVLCRRGDECWSIIGDELFCEDALFYMGMIYSVSKHGKIAVYDASDEIYVKVLVIDTPCLFPCDMLYLANYGDDFFLVARLLVDDFDVKPERPETAYNPTYFKVYKKLDLGLNEPSWEMLTSLGDKALFLGGNSSLCLVASHFPGCRRNCIYFTDDYSEYNCVRLWADFDVGIFHLDDESIRIDPITSCPRNSHTGSYRASPLRVMPNPC